MSEKVKYYKGKFFFVFYEKDDETLYGTFNNVKEVVAEMKRLHTFPLHEELLKDGSSKWIDLNDTPITRKEVQFISTKIARSLVREKYRRHLINVFGRLMRVYAVDIFDDNEDNPLS